ncbi:MAG: bifunctional demethylmenaquinone methyltransferase/2-methoxy-6-polyprenyl-1,4-benzoquinol methylase UbiE [Rhodospirillaceae bacterium]
MKKNNSANTTNDGSAAGTTHFGYRDVPEADKAGLVKDVFSSVADKYDLMNDLMSLGVHRLWKAAMLDWLRPRAGMKLLDVGGGTGDIAFRFLERGVGTVTVCDINEDMMAVGRDRALDRGMLPDAPGAAVEWVTGDAEALPFPDNSFDAYTIAFCIRNVTRPENALKEARRVLRPGGRFLCLEFSRVVVPMLDELYDQYSFEVLPALGERVAGDRASYQYLSESIRKFPAQDDFARMICAAGLARVEYRNLSGGIAAMHSAWRT